MLPVCVAKGHFVRNCKPKVIICPIAPFLSCPKEWKRWGSRFSLCRMAGADLQTTRRRSARLAALDKTSQGHPQQSTTGTQELATSSFQAADVSNLTPHGQSVRRPSKRRPKLLPLRTLEEEVSRLGFQRIAGVDEVGRGPLAGPVVAAACCIPLNVHIEGINDSKKLTERQRTAVYESLTTHPCIATATCIVGPETIDKINILQATLLAMRQALDQLQPAADFVLVDGNQLPLNSNPATCRTVIGGDASCQLIAAASIIAKVTRDRLMLKYDDMYPQYGFAQHKGYGTAKHLQALKEYGPCPIHRMSFAPMRITAPIIK